MLLWSETEIAVHQRIHAPEALDRRHAVWPGGRFDAGLRRRTPYVRGRTEISQHLLLVTLKGSARRLRVRTDCGHRHEGRDLAGAVSFVPAGCARVIELEDVEAEWGSIAFDPGMLGPEDGAISPKPFTNARDPFLASLVGALDTTHRLDGAIEPAYAEAMGLALARHLSARHGGAAEAPETGALPLWKLRRVEAFVEANLARPIVIAELAAVAGLSAGRFHRAFRAATGQTPLRFLQEARVRRATVLLRGGQVGMLDIAAEVGFTSPSHFARVFRAIAGIAPSQAR